MIKNTKLKQAIIKAVKGLYFSLPLLLGVIMLIALLNSMIPQDFYSKIFTKNILLDPLIGSSIGSILAGNPITSYVIGGELLKNGVSLIAVTSFILAWVTVGIVQFPAEAMLLGKKFAITRNVLSFIFSIIVAITSVAIFNLF